MLKRGYKPKIIKVIFRKFRFLRQVRLVLYKKPPKEIKMKLYKVTVPFACYKTGDIIQLNGADSKTFEKFIEEVKVNNKKSDLASNRQMKTNLKNDK